MNSLQVLKTELIAPNHAQLPYVLCIGKKRVNVRDLADASFAFQDVRDMFFEQNQHARSGDLPNGLITVEGVEYVVSFNGRVWRKDKSAPHGLALVLESQ